MILDRRQLIGGLAAASALAGGASLARVAEAAGFQTLAGAMSLPKGPALNLRKPLRRIGVGSCFNQTKPGSLLATAMRARPDLFLFMGDNVYGDTLSPNLDELVGAYAAALARPDYRAFRASTPIRAVWDDHDFGQNDAGAAYRYKQQSRLLFFDFWDVPADSPRRRGSGVYDAFVVGPPGQRTQIIQLDLRMFRDAWTPTDKPDAPGRERYIENPDPSRTILGPAQWAWLEHQLMQPADLRIIVSSYQLLADGHGWERWGLFPVERRRFYDLLARTRASGVVIVSGDRHRAGVYREDGGLPYPLHELTSSAINMGWTAANDPGEEAGPNRVGPTFRPNNVGMVDVDWNARTVVFEILDAKDQVVLRHVLSMDQLRA